MKMSTVDGMGLFGSIWPENKETQTNLKQVKDQNTAHHSIICLFINIPILLQIQDPKRNENGSNPKWSSHEIPKTPTTTTTRRTPTRRRNHPQLSLY
jgi:hypothetical protein